MLQNAYLLAKIGADTAENEQHFAEILSKTGNYPTGPMQADPLLSPLTMAPSAAFTAAAISAFFSAALSATASLHRTFRMFWKNKL